MRTETRTVRIAAPKQQVWDVIADFGGIYKYNPSVTKSYSTSEANAGVGASRHCDLTFSGASVDEQIVSWDEGDRYQVRLVDGTRIPPFKEVVATIALEEDGDETVAHMSFDYSMKYGPFGRLMDAFVVQRQYAKALTLILAGLKHYVETGEEVAGVRVDTLAVTG